MSVGRLRGVWGWGLMACAALWGCDEGPTAPAADAVVAEDARPAEDAGGPAVGEACPDGRCGAGECLGGYCARPCLDDVDCPEANLICVARGSGSHCAPACLGALDCAPREVCVTDGPGRGACATPGPAGANEGCDTGLDCASLQCSGGVCLGACDAASCPVDQVCLDLHTQRVCARAGEGAPEALCSLGADCRSGVCRGGGCSETCATGAEPLACGNDRICRDYAQLSLCERPCASAADCGDEAACVLVGGLPQCQTRGPRPAAEACTADAQCAALLCVNGTCAQTCAVDGGCPTGLACVTDLLGALCRPAGFARAGDPCALAADCASGVCVGGVCTASCARAACPAGQLCGRFLTGAFCLATCADSADCAPAAFCDAGLAAAPVCFWRGANPEGEGCARHRDCASGRCVGDRCRAACADGQCAAGEICAALADGAGAACVTEPRAAGVACAGGDCAEGTRCVAGTCQPACAAGCPEGSLCAEGADGQAVCHPGCRDATDCRPGRTCQRLDGAAAHCTDVGPLADGAACVRSAQCSSGACLGGVCRAPCGTCPSGERCVALAGGGYCLPEGAGGPGAPCIGAEDCAGLLCAEGRCAPPCPAGTCADAGRTCTDSAEGGACRVVCNPLDSLEDVAMLCPGGGCRPAADGRGRCAANLGSGSGAACTEAADCAPPLTCVRRGAEAGLCAQPCAADAQCAMGEACARPEATMLGGCVAAGAAPHQADCAADADCASGWCEAGRCARACADDADCSRPEAPFDACVDVDRSPYQPRRRCAVACTVDTECPAGRSCRLDALARGACW